ncbi:phospholipase A2-alpha [Carex littledalei]|uniref:phospholipase A2 n=1 Tax=Carex littledalei TaxID=544730 RepID=A0A833R697_9POAL|nr:phospholipase A2-alpha [Carex littledalei]
MVFLQSLVALLLLSSKQECSRTCESENCSIPPILRYGKYCGVMYTGCPGEKPCDSLDACCMVHDACVAASNNDYLNLECNQNLLNCISKVNTEGPTFQGNKCSVDQVIQDISLIMDAAILAGRALHKP